MTILTNPFVTSGYVSPEYFCDRVRESEHLIGEITNGNNLALISTRRMGKSGLIEHCFGTPGIARQYYTFFVDIYATASLRDFVFLLSKVILEGLKPQGKKALQRFWDTMKSIQAGIAFDVSGNPSFHLQLGDIKSEEITLDEIFRYLDGADRPCVVAIDEFQQISGYPEKNVEALLRTYIQRCKNARFIFAGSQRHVMGNMFLSASRPFYQSVSVMYLESIALAEYKAFAIRHFGQGGKAIVPEVIEALYRQFEGITWYMQKMLNVLYSATPIKGNCTTVMIPLALENVIDSFKYIYLEMLFRIPEKQKELLIALAKEGKASAITSGEFVRKYRLSSPSSVQSALRGLLEKDFVTLEQGSYQVYDRFFGMWLRENF